MRIVTPLPSAGELIPPCTKLVPASHRRPKPRKRSAPGPRRPPSARLPVREVPRTSRQRSGLAAAQRVFEVLVPCFAPCIIVPNSIQGILIYRNVNTKTEPCYQMSPEQCRMARAALQIGVRDLATLAKVSASTVARFEAGDELKERTVDAMRAALENAGVEFIAENGGGPGVRLKPKKTK